MNAVIASAVVRVRGAAVRTIFYDSFIDMFMNPARLAGEPQCLVDFVFGDRHVALAPCRIRRLPLFLRGKSLSRWQYGAATWTVRALSLAPLSSTRRRRRMAGFFPSLSARRSRRNLAGSQSEACKEEEEKTLEEMVYARRGGRW